MPVRDDEHDKVARLPSWARHLIERLEKEAEPNNSEIKMHRQEIETTRERLRRAQARMEFMAEVFQCGAKGGSEIAKAAVDKLANEWLATEEYWEVTIATQGRVAVFVKEDDANDYANSLRDAIGEARGLTSAVSVRKVNA